ncbi:DUF2690 domain-containing protein [Streptomyces sp. NEAU-sy36]|uniref:DUF2690 domain-containing protein n=1 Tax=unclassified Streptomyces TaxID=2593676 RepID=UPI0015D57550|nr:MULTISPECIES: DUF2690 domain-containing protein [unclassified Streptomyces]QLJ05337.1 DUF2690 domain-containing protein [Streptomyces sp. NEAU-sy36]
MPRWNTLPKELDPEIKEFVNQLRWLVDLGGLHVADLADRTGYGRSSWESYLAGELLAPKGAAVALAEAAGASPAPIVTMWELAERAWRRTEAGLDHTAQALRVFAASGDSGAPSTRASKGVAALDGPRGTSPGIPAQPTAAEADARDSSAGRRGSSRTAARSGGWPQVTGTWDGGRAEGPGTQSGGWPKIPAQAPRGPITASPTSPAGPVGTTAPLNPVGPPPPPGAHGPHTPPGRPNPQGPDAGSPSGTSRAAGYRQPALMFLAGFVTVLLVILGVFHFTGKHGAGHAKAAARPAPTISAKESLPPGVRCAGSDCVGKDAETMGCSGDQVATAQTVSLGATTLEVRYSKVCGTAWGRITNAVPGDKVEVTGVKGTARQTGEITAVGETIAYTPMIAVRDPAEAKACAALASGRTACTK